MNQLLSKAGAIIVTVTVFLFAVCIVCGADLLSVDNQMITEPGIASRIGII